MYEALLMGVAQEGACNQQRVSAETGTRTDVGRLLNELLYCILLNQQNWRSFVVLQWFSANCSACC